MLSLLGFGFGFFVVFVVFVWSRLVVAVLLLCCPVVCAACCLGPPRLLSLRNFYAAVSDAAVLPEMTYTPTQTAVLSRDSVVPGAGAREGACGGTAPNDPTHSL
eukprot:195301-Rhodomonas_salina.2